MENNFANTLKKRALIKEYKETALSAINSIIDKFKYSIDFYEQTEEEEKEIKTIKDLKVSIERYSALKNKILEDKELVEYDFQLLGIVCLRASRNIMSSAEKLIEASEKLKDLSEAFIS